MTQTTIKNKDLKPGDVVVGPTAANKGFTLTNLPEYFRLEGTDQLTKGREYVVIDVDSRSWKTKTEETNYLYVVLQSTHTDGFSSGGNVFIGLPENETLIKVRDANDADLVQIASKVSGKLYGVSVGADPEIFLRDAKTKQTIPAFTVLIDKKEATEKGMETAYWDGFQAEFNTLPNQCLAYQVDSIARSLKNLVNSAQTAVAKRKEVQLSTKTVIDLHSNSFKEAKREHVEFGCMPSLNAYRERNKMANGAEIPFRMAGGHLHFGWEEMHRPDKAECELMVKNLDKILGVYCVALFHKYDDKRRRALYGRAGEYRKPPHGLEYRVLSNAWLIHPMYAHLVFELGRLCISTRHLTNLWKATEEETRSCINNCDLRLAKKLLMRNAPIMKALLSNAAGKNADYGERLFKLAFDGADSILDTATTLESRWNVDTRDAWITHSDGPGKNIKTAMALVVQGAALG